MKQFLFFALLLSIFTGCGSSKHMDDSPKSNLITTANHSTSNQENNQSQPATTIQQTTKSKPKPIPKPKPKPIRTLTVYVHGYDPKGFKERDIFGDIVSDPFLDQIADFADFTPLEDDDGNATDVVTATSYYGNTPPDYYTPQDEVALAELDAGIPRYAFIVAKFAKHLMETKDFQQINIVSASMGSLVTRYLIQKDLEHLASEKRIAKWLSLEGVIAGNIGASNSKLKKIYDQIEKDQAPEVDQMRYKWIKAELGDTYITTNPNFKNIQIAFESSTNDHLNNQLITLLTNEPNDGVQAVKDTYFHNTPSYAHTLFYQTHDSLSRAKAAWAYTSTFLKSQKRVKITLLRAKVFDLHENKVLFQDFKPAEIVFASKTYAPQAMQQWGFDTPIDERLLKGHTLKLYKYRHENSYQDLNQTLFDAYILPKEDHLTLEITPYELDFDTFYGIFEPTGHGRHESLGSDTIDLPIHTGEYRLESEEWEAIIRVKVMGISR